MLFAVVWLACWCIDSYENRKGLIAEACTGAKKSCWRSCLCVCWRGRAVRSKVLDDLLAGILCVFGVTAMCLSVSIAESEVWDKLGTFVVVAILAFGSLRKSMLAQHRFVGSGPSVRDSPCGDPCIGLVGRSAEAGSHLERVHPPGNKVRRFSPIMIILIWFGLMGAYLMIHE